MDSKNSPAKAFCDLLIAQYSSRDLIKLLGIGHLALKQHLADPSLFSLRELRLLATLLGRDEMEVARAIFAEMSLNPQAAADLKESADQVVGRQRARRVPKRQKEEAQGE